jgi:hypothetical protein
MPRDGKPGLADYVTGSISLGMTRVCLAKMLNFACLFRHAISDFLPSLFAAEFGSRFRTDTKARITLSITDAESARD